MSCLIRCCWPKKPEYPENGNAITENTTVVNYGENALIIRSVAQPILKRTGNDTWEVNFGDNK